MSNSDRIVHFYSSASFVSRHAPPKRSQMAPRTVLAPGVHGIVLGLPGGGRGEHPRPLPHASCRLSRHAPYGSFHPATSHRRSRVTTALSELPASSRADCRGRGQHVVTVLSRAGGSKRGAAQPSQDDAARGPSGACRISCGGEARRSAKEGGHLARATDASRERGRGFSLPNARSQWYRSRTCSSRPLSS